MARAGGIALKSLQLLLRVLEFCCTAVVFAIYVYFISALSANDIWINTYVRSIVGISGVGILYTVAAFLLVCCLGGFGFFALLALVLDLAFAGAFIYVAYQTRFGANSCSGFVYTPLGAGNVNDPNFQYVPDRQTSGLPSLRNACRMNTATFAVSIIAIVLFVISAVVEIGMWRARKSEKKYGPSPANGYTSGSGNRKFWQRKPRQQVAQDQYMTGTVNPDRLPVHQQPADMSRASYATENTAVGTEAPYHK